MVVVPHSSFTPHVEGRGRGTPRPGVEPDIDAPAGNVKQCEGESHRDQPPMSVASAPELNKVTYSPLIFRLSFPGAFENTLTLIWPCPKYGSCVNAPRLAKASSDRNLSASDSQPVAMATTSAPSAIALIRAYITGFLPPHVVKVETAG